MEAYRKLIVAVAGLGAMLLTKYTGVSIPGLETVFTDLIISGLTAAGVWAVPNAPLPARVAR